MSTIIITEGQFRELHEVRYIDASVRDQNIYNPNKPYRRDWYDVYNQEKISNNESIRVFHGCNINTALEICTKGTSGKEYHPRHFSYESGMNPLGIFVTVDFSQAKKFGYDPNTTCILEFTVKASDLESPVWNGAETYFVQNSNPQPFRNSAERKQQKATYDNNAKNVKDDEYWDYKKNKISLISKEHIRNSDKPSMAHMLFDNSEHQALFMGDLNPNMIKRVWVCENNGNTYTKYDRKDFLRKFGKNTRRNGMVGEKLFNPNDNVKSVDDVVTQIMKKFGDLSAQDVMRGMKAMGLLDNPPSSQQAINFIKRNLWPKQIIQLYGRNFFNEWFNRLEQDF